MANTGDILEAVRKGGPAAGTDAKDLAKGPAVEPVADPLADLMDEPTVTVDADHKLRLVYKGESLADLLAFTGGKAVEGENQVAFKIGDHEVSDVLRTLFRKAREVKVTLRDVISLIKSKAAK